MATFVLGAVGTIYGGVYGGYVGAALGAYIDNTYLFPLLFPDKPLQGSRLDDRVIQLASEGTPLNWAIGSRISIPGFVFWASETRAVEENSGGGGKGGGTSTPGAAFYRYFVDVAIAISSTDALPDGRINALKKVWADAIVMFGDGAESHRYETITLYKGDQTDPDPTIEAVRGVGNTPAFVNTAYVLIKGLELSDFGRIPNFRFLIEQNSNTTLAAAIGYVMTRYDYEENEWDTSTISQCFLGEAVSGPQDGATVLGPLEIAYGLGVQETGGQIVFFERGEETIIDATLGDMATRDFDSQPLEPLELTDRSDYELPLEVNVTFTSTENDFQQGSEQDVRQYHESDNVVELSLPLTLEPSSGKAIARRVLWTAEAERQTMIERLPPSYIGTQEGDIVRVTKNGVTHLIYVAEINRGLNSIIEIRGHLTDQSVHTQSGETQDSGVIPGIVVIPAQTLFQVMDLPPLSDVVIGNIGMYFSIGNKLYADTWGGAALYSATEETGPYFRRSDAPTEGTLGTVLVPPLDGVPWDWDEVNTLTVQLTSGELTSSSQQECLDGTNRAAIRNIQGLWEILGFQQVEDLGDNKYRLSMLLRGTRGTEHAATGHTLDAPFVLVSDPSTGFWARGIGALGSNHWHKAPALGGRLPAFEAVQARLSGESMRPFSPTHLVAEKGPGNRDNFVTIDGGSVVVSSTDNSFTAAIGTFSDFSIGMYVTASGFTGANEGRHLVTAVTGGGARMVVDTILSNESVTFSSFVEGSPNDVRVQWERRGKYLGSLYALSPAAVDELPIRFVARVRNGGVESNILREWEVGEGELIYTQEEQVSDGLSSPYLLTIEVRQISSMIGEGHPALLEFSA